MSIHNKMLTLSLLSLFVAGPAAAMTFSVLTYENDHGADVGGLNLWFEVEDGGSHLDFTFYNSSTIASTVANIYFESTGSGLDLGSAWVAEESAGVDFEVGGSPSNPAPGTSLNWGGTLARFRAEDPAPHNGINANLPPADAEWLKISFQYGTSDYASVVSDLSEGRFRVAQHVTGLPESIWTVSGGVTDPVPLPATVWLLGSGLLGWVGTNRLRRRK